MPATKTKSTAKKKAASKAKTKVETPMKALRRRLSTAGVKPKFLNEKILPEWWDDEIADTGAGFQEATAIIASRLGFPMRDLLSTGAELQVATPSGVKFKKSKDKTVDDVALTTQLAGKVAQLAARAFTDEAAVQKIPDPGEWREKLLAQSDKEWVCLRHLIEATWQLGIPVIHISSIPRNAKKPDALTTIIDGRPVIVILNQRKNPSWLAFILAHELGHIYHKHLSDGETIVDQKLSEQTGEQDEAEADEFATALLTGYEDVGPFTSRTVSANILVKLARQFGSRYKIAPGVAVLQWAFMTAEWAMAMRALQILEKADDALCEFQEATKRHINSDMMTEDQWDWLNGLCL